MERHRLPGGAARASERDVRVAGNGSDVGFLTTERATSDRSLERSVLYVGGWGRSGSTLLGLALGQLPGFVHVGELRQIWRRGVVLDQLCGCGAPFGDCPFWRAVGLEAFGGWATVDRERLLGLQAAVDRLWAVPLLGARRFPGAVGPRLREYGQVLERLYDGIRAVSGSPVVVDSSKDPPHAFVLRAVGTFDLRVAHLVRDSRAVAHSWTRVVRRPEVRDRAEYMDTYGPVHSALRWTLFNGLFDALAALGVPRVLIRYELFARAPADELRRLLAAVGAPEPSDLPFLAASGLRLTEQHTVSGNPVRFARNVLEIRCDERWRSEMSARDRRVVSALTWPMLLRYGYPLDPSAPSGS